MTTKIGLIILGGTGFGAGELLRLLIAHPEISLCSAISTSSPNQLIELSHPHLAGLYPQKFAAGLDLSLLKDFQDQVIVSCLPHGESAKQLEPLIGNKSLKIVDLSADYRADSRFVYGLPELNHEALGTSRLVANPGCLATAAILGLLPLHNLTQGKICIDAKTGSSGAGKELGSKTHHPVRHANIFAYKALEHQHQPEIIASLSQIGFQSPHLSFVPQSTPLSRGIYVTTHLTLKQELSAEDLLQHYRNFYKNSRFIRVSSAAPEVENVIGSNFCDIGLVVKGKDLVVFSAIDNLVKGMAGQAIQNINLICGLPENTGLWCAGMRPI